MTKTPCVTVLMSIYNAADFLVEAVQSILGQTFQDFEFLIINDGSTDSSSSLLAHFRDPRIRVITNPRNMGLTRSLNIGLEQAVGKYIARMDADDVALPERLAKQIVYLDKHSPLGILGTALRIIDANGRYLRTGSLPSNDLQIRWTGLFSNPFGHSSVMLRRETLLLHQLRYDEHFPAAEDYDLWMRLLRHAQGANLREPLLKCRAHAACISAQNRRRQLESHDRIMRHVIKQELPTFPMADIPLRNIRSLFVGDSEVEFAKSSNRSALASIFLDMLTQFLRQHPDDRGRRSVVLLAGKNLARNFILRKPPQWGWSMIMCRWMKMLFSFAA